MSKGYSPISINISTGDKSIFDVEADIKFNSNIDYPLSHIGFQHFLHSIRKETERLQKFEGKKKMYLVMNPFERYINEYNKSIGDISKTYFKIEKDTPNILSRGFYKLWEIILMGDLIDIEQNNFVSTHLAEGPGSFIQATMFYRDCFCKKGLSKNDKYYAITVHPEDTKGHVPEIEKQFTDYYNREKPIRFILHKTVNKTMVGGSNYDNGDLTHPKTLNNFCGGGENSTIKEKVDFITADGGFEWVNENIQEQEYFRLLFSQIVIAINIQKKGGIFVCKFFETLTNTSLKFLSILTSLYDEVILTKPLTSRPSNSEKYAVCKGFKYSENDVKLKNIIKSMNDLHSKIHNNKTNIVDLFTKYTFTRKFLMLMLQINKEIANKQFKAIGEIMTFADGDNYINDVYHDRRDAQIKAAAYWTDLYLMPLDKYKSNKTKIMEILDKSVKENIEKSKELDKIIV